MGFNVVELLEWKGFSKPCVSHNGWNYMKEFFFFYLHCTILLLITPVLVSHRSAVSVLVLKGKNSFSLCVELPAF